MVKINNAQFKRELFLIFVSFVLTIISGIAGGYTVHYLITDNSPQLFITNEIIENGIKIHIINTGRNPAIGFELNYMDELPPEKIPIIKKEEVIIIPFTKIIETYLYKSNLKLYEWDKIKSPLNINLKSSCNNCDSSDILEINLIKEGTLDCQMNINQKLLCSFE